MKKVLIIVIFVAVFAISIIGSFSFVRNIDNKDTNILANDKKENTESHKINEHIIEQKNFFTGYEWNGEIVSKFPDDERYRVNRDIDTGLYRNLISSEEVYKEYAERMNGILPEKVDFEKCFVVLITAEQFKHGPEEDLEIADFDFSEDNGTLKVILKERENPRANAYLNYNAWYAIIDDRSLLRPAIDIVIDLEN